jgi:MFS family permease
MFFCLVFCVFAIMVHLAPHAIELDISPASAANILATVGGLSIVGKVVMGRAGDSIGSRQALIIGFVLMSAALFGLVPTKMAWMMYSIAGVFGFAYGACVASQSPLVAVLFGLSAHGLILGVMSFGFTMGGAVGPLLTGLIFDFSGSYQLAFSVGGAVSFVGLILTIVLKPRSVR